MKDSRYPELNEQSAAFIEKMRKEQPAPGPQKLSEAEEVQQQREGFRKAIPAAGPPEAIFKVEERNIPLQGRDIPVRLYYGNDQPQLPVLVYYHGGGFIAGGFDTHEQMLHYLAKHAGVLVASVGYRLAPEHPHPAAVDDAFEAFQWVQKHVAEISGDSGRIAIGGDSSGGALAVVTAMKARDGGHTIPIFQLLFCPSLDLTMSSDSWKQLGDKGYILNAEMVKKYYNWYVPHGTDKREPGISPLFAPDFSNLPQALIVTASADPQKDEGRIYAENLETAGVPVAHHEYQGAMHGFYQMSAVFDDGKAALEEAASALAAAFKI